jgi:hypothetical protein
VDQVIEFRVRKHDGPHVAEQGCESRAAQRHYKEVERAVAHLHGMLELLRQRA